MPSVATSGETLNFSAIFGTAGEYMALAKVTAKVV